MSILLTQISIKDSPKRLWYTHANINFESEREGWRGKRFLYARKELHADMFGFDVKSMTRIDADTLRLPERERERDLDYKTPTNKFEIFWG